MGAHGWHEASRRRGWSWGKLHLSKKFSKNSMLIARAPSASRSSSGQLWFISNLNKLYQVPFQISSNLCGSWYRNIWTAVWSAVELGPNHTAIAQEIALFIWQGRGMLYSNQPIQTYRILSRFDLRESFPCWLFQRRSWTEWCRKVA